MSDMKDIPMANSPEELPEMLKELGSDHRMLRCRPYDGQPWTDMGKRGATEIKGITFRDLRDCFIRAFILASNDGVDDVLYLEANKGENACLCENDVYGRGDIDPIAVAQSLSCEVEKLMEIFPNIPKEEEQ